MESHRTFMSYFRPVLATVVVTGLLAYVSCKKDDNNNNNNNNNNNITSAQDRTFVGKAGMSNRAEIDLGQLAVSKATDTSVKNFAQLMINEHTLAQNDLKMVGSHRSITVPDTVDAAHKSLKQQLMNMSGRAFDSMYIHKMVDDHNMTLADFNTEIGAGSDDSMQNYATKYKPHIQMHLEKAQGIANKFQ